MSSNSSRVNQVFHTLTNVLDSVVQSLVPVETSPEIPFSSTLPEEVKPGLLISINGRVLDHANRFDVNLISETENVVFHFNPRFSQKCVVRNTRIDDVWGEEERDGAFPFVHSTAFDILILVTQDCYRVSINGKHFTDYKHRLPLNEVKQIRIDGDVRINCVKYGTEPLYLKTENPLALRPSTLYNPILPLNHDISGKVVPGFMIYISGKPFSNPYRFSIDFKRDIDASKGVQFHFNPRFDDNTVVRNSYSGDWGEEERWVPFFPFSRGTGFDMIFLVRETEFMVAINGQHFVNFEHRLLPLSDIKYFSINGHLTINSVRFCEAT